MGLGVNGLGIARSLAGKDISIFGLYSDFIADIGRFSKHVRPIKVAKLKYEPEKLLEQLLTLGKKIGNKSFLIPQGDIHVSFISENREILSEYFLFNIPDKNLLDKILTKKGNMELAAQHNILIPKTLYLKDKNDIEKVINKFKFPIIIKPLDTFSTKFPGGKKNIVNYNKDSFIDLTRDNESLLGNCVIQELIIGNDGNIFICSTYFSKESEPLGVYTGRKIRQFPPDFGVTSCGISEYVPEIELISMNFLKRMGYKGLGTLEFARDINSGKYYFIEINGRSYYHNMLFTDCGVNLSYIAYCDTMDINMQYKSVKQKEGLIWIDFSRDIESFWIKRKENKIKTVEWLQSVIKAKSFTVFNKLDILPFLFSTFILMTVIFKYTIKGLKSYVYSGNSKKS